MYDTWTYDKKTYSKMIKPACTIKSKLNKSGVNFITWVGSKNFIKL